jgi:hypothetical protein
MSLVAHACFIVIASLVLVRGGGGAGDDEAGGGAAGPVEMAVMTQGDLAALEAAAESAGSLPAIPDLPPESGPQDPARTEDMIVADASTSGGAAATLEGDLGGGGDLSSGAGEQGLGGSGSGGGTGASFFGVEATGSRFAFLVDVSGSMDGRRIENLREQLTRSINAMTVASSFLVVAFSSEHMIMGGKAEWREASDSGKRWARSLMGTLVASGGTEPLSGLEVIHAMRPRPDAIYFMTDGEFGDAVMPAIQRLREKVKIPIHCICLGSPAGELAMKEIAALTKGTYKFVPE